MPIADQDLALVNDRSSLFRFLQEKLGWPVEPDDTFTYAVKIEATLPSLPTVSQIVPFNEHDPFVILLAEFKDGYKRSDLRLILRDIRKSVRERGIYNNHKTEEFIFVCPSQCYSSVSFVHFEEREGRQPRIEVFGWDADRIGESRTLRELNLPQLAMPMSNLIGETDWTIGYKKWLSAWDVEQVTTKFFDDYKRVFESVEKRIIGVSGNKRLFTQRLFNRLMFIQFLSKKGWLRFPDIDGSPDYLNLLFAASEGQAENFYSDRLYWSFFYGLGTCNDVEEVHSLAELVQARGYVPYLNGGLFEMVDADDSRGAVWIPNEAFSDILRMFSQYNFTITESTPLDITVAVDPEMLGRVFEKLVTGRHESGSYYTPRPVVSFMCREALKGYLSAENPNLAASVSAFVDDGDASGLSDPEAVLTALKEVTVCDPACGSGAYLLGMMQELLRLREKLFAAKVRDHAKTYDRKLEIIERNVYGVDKDTFAVNVAMLRLWLSLVVDDERDPLSNPSVRVALPNLRYKIVVGDSLTAQPPDVSKLTLGQREYSEDAARMRKLHHAYFSLTQYKPNSITKSDIEKQIKDTQTEIQKLFGSEASPGVLDWRSEFAEVFAPLEPSVTIDGGQLALVNEAQAQQVMLEPRVGGGFHIVLANPPYVRADPQFRHLAGDEVARQSAISEYKVYRASLVKSRIYATLHEKWDLYIPFLERAYQLLQHEGGMVFIIPDAYNVAKYTAKSHEFFLQNTSIERIDFCSEINIFDAGVNNTILYFVKKRADEYHVPVRVRRWGADRERFDDNEEVLATFPQTTFGKELFKPSVERNAAAGSVTLSQLCYVSVGMVIHSDEDDHLGEFEAQDLLSNIQDHLHSKRFVFGKDVVKWNLRNIRYLEWGTQRAPAYFRRVTFPELQDALEKLIAVRTPGKTPKVTYDNNSLHFDASSIGFVPWHQLKTVRNKSISKTAKYRAEVRPKDVQPVAYREELEDKSRNFDLKYLLGVMNSDYAQNWLTNARRSKLHIYPDDWKGLPIPQASLSQQAEIAVLVQKCLDNHGVGCTASEAEINDLVDALYAEEQKYPTRSR